jgi:hypothetical protein
MSDQTPAKSENASYVARYKDPFETFSSEGGPGIQGKLLTCKKGIWAIGADEDQVPAGTRYLAIVPSMMRGYLKWIDGKVVDARMGLVIEGYLMPHRYSLGDDDDEAQWEIHNDKPRDPWSRCHRMVLVELSPPHGELTFSSSAFGAEIALKELAGTYSREKPGADALPVVELGMYMRPNRHGKIPSPLFMVVGWATLEDVLAGRKRVAAKAPPKAKAAKGKAKPAPAPTVAEQIDDRPPDWGTVHR